MRRATEKKSGPTDYAIPGASISMHGPANFGQVMSVKINMKKSISSRKAGNYAWPLKEGHHDFLTNRPKGPDALLDPIIEYPHKEGQSITGGVVYHGKEFPSLRESYIYADYVSGKIWAYPSTDDGKLPKATVLIDSDLSISSITLDQNGEILLCAHRQGKLYRLQRRDKEK